MPVRRKRSNVLQCHIVQAENRCRIAGTVGLHKRQRINQIKVYVCRIELALNVDFIIRHLAEIVGKFVYFPAKSRDIFRIQRKPDSHGMTASVCEKIRTGKNSVAKRKSLNTSARALCNITEL